MNFIDDAARCADGEEDDGDADEGIVEVTSGSEGIDHSHNRRDNQATCEASLVSIVCNTYILVRVNLV